jgi:nucleotide sugar dehydrogenase
LKLLDLSEHDIREALVGGKITACVVGLGRIGLPTATLFANSGIRVIGVDINPQVVQEIGSGSCRFSDEPGLAELVKKVVGEGKLKTALVGSKLVAKSDVVVLCVPTPINDSKVPDPQFIIKACGQIAETLPIGSVIVVESTVSPGAVEDVLVPTIEERSGMKAGRDFGIVSCPERANPGNTLSNMRSVPRIIGGFDQRSAKAAAAIYRHVLGVKIIIVSDPKTANAVKLTENIFRDVNIALMNEFATLYEKLGIDTIEVINACASKWNFVPHYPGAGVGGPCLPANAYYVIDQGLRVGYIPHLIRMAREINDRMPDHVVKLVTEALNDIGKVVRSSRIVLLGVSYKPDLHDLQMTPLKRIYQTLLSMGARITIYDPMFRGEEVFGSKVSSTLDESLRESDCILIGTAHQEFRNLDLAKISKSCNSPAALVDTQNIIEPTKAKEAGFSYLGVGRRTLSINWTKTDILETL